MKKLVFIDASISVPAVHVPVGVLRLELGAYEMKTLVIRDTEGKEVLTHCIPVPQWAEAHIFETWKENLKEKVVWPLPQNYIKSFRKAP